MEDGQVEEVMILAAEQAGVEIRTQHASRGELVRPGHDPGIVATDRAEVLEVAGRDDDKDETQCCCCQEPEYRVAAAC
jgi:hypothetical protein